MTEYWVLNGQLRLVTPTDCQKLTIYNQFKWNANTNARQA